VAEPLLLISAGTDQHKAGPVLCEAKGGSGNVSIMECLQGYAGGLASPLANGPGTGGAPDFPLGRQDQKPVHGRPPARR
jgi:hypothetical protein